MKKIHSFLRLRLALLAAVVLAALSAAAYAAVNSGNASLTELELRVDGKNILQGFNASTTSYSLELDDAALLTMSAVPAASDAQVAITMNGAVMGNHSLAQLDGGENTIVYTVKSGSASKTYTVNIKTPETLRNRVFNWRNATVYFVLTDRFNNGDTSNDESYHRSKSGGASGNIATFHGGDIKGLTAKLDYLDKLGVDAIWITAPYEQMHGWTGGKDNAFVHYAFHGYYALDWTYMDRNMGTIQEMKDFVTEAHKRGIRVVMDIVLNHTGYFTLQDCLDYNVGDYNGSPSNGWIPSSAPFTMWSDSQPVSFNTDNGAKWGAFWGKWVRAFGDKSWGSQYFASEGGDDLTKSLAGLPDVFTESTASVAIPTHLKTKWGKECSGDFLNYRLPNIDSWRQDNKGAPADYLINWLAGWVEYFGIDGFRCDTAKHVEVARWNQLKQACKQALANWRASDRADQYAKNWTDDFWMTGEAWGWDHGDTKYFTSGGFDSMINFAFNGTEGGSGRTPSTSDWDYYANFCNKTGGHQVLNYVSSHDTGLHRGDSKNIANMLLLCPGGAQIYYGDETARPVVNSSDPGMKTRSDMNWDAVDSDDNKHWQLVGQFRRRNVAVGASAVNTNLGSDTYGRRFDEGGVKNAVVIKLNTTAGQQVTVNVGDFFADGQKVMDGMNVANTAVVSGGKVTITASANVLLLEEYGTISGGGDTPTPTPTPTKPVVTASPASGATFSESITVTLSVNPSAAVYYTTDGSSPSSSSSLYSAPLTFTETTTLKTYAANEAGAAVQSFTYTKSETPTPTPGDDYYIYFDNSDGWASTPKAYAWDSSNQAIDASWPGRDMTRQEGSLWYISFSRQPSGLIILDGKGQNDSNKAGGGDLQFANGHTYKSDGTHSSDSPTPTPTPTGNTIYFDNSSANWSTPYVHCWPNGTSWPGATMTPVSGSIWSYTAPDGVTGILFHAGGGASQTSNFAFKAGYLYNTSGPVAPYSAKPSISISPNGGKVKSTATINVTIGNTPTSVTVTFAGKSVSMPASGGSIAVSSFLTDGQTGALTVSAVNAEGSTTASASFTCDDTQPDPGTLSGDWRELSIYQVMVGSYMHGEGGASGYSEMWGPNERCNGNLRGIINSLDYMKSLGMNALWMTPIFDSTNGTGGEKLQATGYFCTDYFNVDPKFGSMAEFEELVEKAHSLGMYVILDGVFGHHGGNPKSSPSGKSIQTGSNVQNVRGTEPGNICFPGSLEFFKEVLKFWTDKGVDGWRLDQCYQAYQGGHNYWYDLRNYLESIAAERKARGEKWGTLAYMVGEDWTSAGNITTTQQDGLKSVMDFDGKDNLVALGNGAASIGWFLASDAAARGYRDSGVVPTLFSANHDTDRLNDNIKSIPALKQRMALLAAYSGPSILYYCDEFGDYSGKLKGQGNSDNWARTSGRITPENDEQRSLMEYTAKCFQARAANPALWRGVTARDSRNGGKTEVITKTDTQTGNKVVCIFSDIDTSVSDIAGEDLINGGSFSGVVKAALPVYIKVN